MAFRIRDYGEGNELDRSAGDVVGTALVVFNGSGNLCRIGRGVRINRTLIAIDGDDNTVEIAAGAGGRFIFRINTDGGTVRIGEGTTAVHAEFFVDEAYSIDIGPDCMLSAAVLLSVSDAHPIVDRASGQRVNYGGDVVLEEHVWLGFQTQILKRVRIGRGSIVGNGAVVTRDVPPDCVVAGNPARVVRENIVWDREIADAESGEPAAAVGAKR